MAATGQFDTTIEIVTPENIAFRYRLAGPFRRLPAYLVDVCLCGLLWGLGLFGAMLVLTLVGLPGVGLGFGLCWWFLLSWFYDGVFETLWNGQSPGKRLLRLRVLSADGQPINAQQAVLRNVLRAADLLPVVAPYALALVVACLNRRFQRIGDLVCGTMVVVEEPPAGVGAVVPLDPQVRARSEQLPGHLELGPKLNRALSAYVARRAQLPRGRRLEIAAHLARPLRARWDLALDCDDDLLLCALFHRVYVADRPAAVQSAARQAGGEAAAA